ncbi:anti-phage dCTP deaminase [Pectinatus frisingensis]|uniref:anti-phage dCTP deaminase n=1 Tax=Pectinatus frisingensis TaxID=865 RepID=UPI003D800FA6
MEPQKSSHELVLALISTVGTDTRQLVKDLEDQLRLVNYKTKYISVSTCIISQFENSNTNNGSEFERITHYMDLGNKIREGAKDNSILMKGVINYIYSCREKDSKGRVIPQNRIAYIIDSIKHPDEIMFMRQIYTDGFYLIGATNAYDDRKLYLTKQKGISKDKVLELLNRDMNENRIEGQHTRDAFQHADYFINITENNKKTNNAISRFIDLLFGNPFITPSFDEYAMFMAYAASLRSADLSRQIGVVIAKNNEIISTGANDCPQFGGGLYWPMQNENGEYEDHHNGRDYKLGYDSNKKEQLEIIKAILEKLGISFNEENINKIKSAGIGDLTEYGRVVHGEMEALLSCARNNISCRNATLYATTFPCHNCAKHIIAAGINKVVYIEPYPKSKALEFYKEEISENNTDFDQKVIFEHFIGVGPLKFIDLFALSSTRWYDKKRKGKDGKNTVWDKEKANLRTTIPLINYIDAEKLACLAFENETKAMKE